MRALRSEVFFPVILAVVFLDQLTKFIAQRNVNWYPLNSGISFGFLADFPGLVPVTGGLVLGLFAVWLFRLRHRLEARDSVAFGLLLGGGVGNIIDRIFRGGVVDFLFVGFGPSFNLADIALIASVGIFLWGAWVGLLQRRRVRIRSG